MKKNYSAIFPFDIEMNQTGQAFFNELALVLSQRLHECPPRHTLPLGRLAVRLAGDTGLAADDYAAKLLAFCHMHIDPKVLDIIAARDDVYLDMLYHLAYAFILTLEVDNETKKRIEAELGNDSQIMH